MNKLFIGLLIAAAGAGVFLLLRTKKNTTTTNGIKKEWIIGKWKADAGKDSAFSSYSYDFLKSGNILRSLNDSVNPDTLHYEWNKAHELVWKENAGDSTGKILSVLKLTLDSLQVQATDSSTILFIKVK
jgi:lysyl-tRNA synthetase class I